MPLGTTLGFCGSCACCPRTIEAVDPGPPEALPGNLFGVDSAAYLLIGEDDLLSPSVQTRNEVLAQSQCGQQWWRMLLAHDHAPK